MTSKDFLQSKAFKQILLGLGGLIVLLLVFQAGLIVGWYQSRSPEHFGERSFEPHGVVGKILKIELPTLVIEGKDQVEKIVSLTDHTEIRRARERLGSTDLKPDDLVVIIGSPNPQGHIEATLIRLIPHF